MKSSVATPIVVNNHGDVFTFLTIDAAERWMEPIDVRNAEYVVYDADGRLLAASVHRAGSFEGIKIEPTEGDLGHAKELRGVVFEFLTGIGMAPDELQGESLRLDFRHFAVKEGASKLRD